MFFCLRNAEYLQKHTLNYATEVTPSALITACIDSFNKTKLSYDDKKPMSYRKFVACPYGAGKLLHKA